MENRVGGMAVTFAVVGEETADSASMSPLSGQFLVPTRRELRFNYLAEQPTYQVPVVENPPARGKQTQYEQI